ncbi:polysaccharide lyase family 8 protein [Ceratobasidium sp. AG-Ba]|nr:polysaccharide lyase family 8 protein [Ceratobasidium sp. AG-Ba]
MVLAKLASSLAATILLGAGLAQADDIQTIYERRLSFAVINSNSSVDVVKNSLDTLRANGTWPSVNYATGCDAQRANWPAADHWSLHVFPMAAAYHGGVEGADQYVKNPELRTAIRRAMEYWFANDFSTIGNGACMDGGGKTGDKCPCGTPGLWNTNWFSNIILVPKLVGQTCLLLRDELTPSELGNCTLITARAYTPFYRKPQPGYVSGANILDIASIGISAGLLENNRTGNNTRLEDAYGRLHNEVVIHPEDRVDGIKPDGSFQQHIGIIYDGNYGKDFSNAILQTELEAVDTQFQGNQSVKDAFATHIGGARWMTFANVVKKVVHWDFSVLGRMITFPAAETLQATSSLKINLTQVQTLGNAWNEEELIRFGTDLADPKPKTANSGRLVGNRMFWNSDYMVHRTKNTVTTVRMLSTRTATSECVNSQNPYGFHLADGTVYRYTKGEEYEDMYATFNWNLVPGTTTDYGNTPLNCANATLFGVDAYAGGASAGDIGIAAMRYKNPFTGAFSFNKAYIFFSDNVQHVLVNSINSASSAPVFSILDQRLQKGEIYLDGESVKSGNYCDVDSLWHAGTGYAFPLRQGTEVSVDAQKKTGSWQSIGTSTQPPSTKDMFSAWIVHDSGNLTQPIEYSVFPNTKSNQDFEDKAERCTPYTVANTNVVSAAVDSTRRTLGAAFWGPEGGAVYVPHMGMTIIVDKPCVFMLKLKGNGSSKGELSLADPTHQSSSVNVRITWAAKGHRRNEGCLGDHCYARRGYVNSAEATLVIQLPTGGMAGSTVTQEFSRDH